MDNYFLYSPECVKILKQLFASTSSRLTFRDNHLAFGEQLLNIMNTKIMRYKYLKVQYSTTYSFFNTFFV